MRNLGLRLGLRVGLATIMLAGLSYAANAAPIVDVNFQGTVENVSDPLNGTFSVGDALTGSFSYDAATPNIGFFPGIGDYFGALTSLTFTIGSYVGGLGPSSLITTRDFPGNDAIFPQTAQPAGPSIGALQPSLFFLELEDSTGTAVSSETLPLTLSLGDFDSGTWTLMFEPSQSLAIQVSGTLDLGATTAVPLPAALPLLLVGLVGLDLVGRRAHAAT